MKVGIVSCYFQKNYGSMLQAYATQMILNQMGIDNETINIAGFHSEIKRAKRRYFLKACFTTDFLFAKFGRVKNEIIKRTFRSEYTNNISIRNKAFDKFRDRMFSLSKQYQSLNELSDSCKNEYDTVLVGSDQLWLPGNIAADYYTLSFVQDDINTVAYATSFGVAELPRDISKKTKIFLRRIRHLSTREETGQKIIEKIIGRKVPIVCDPSLLLSAEEWMQIQPKTPIIEGAYILCYFLGSNPNHRSFVRRLKEQTGFKIVCLAHIDEYVKCEKNFADIEPYNIDPAEFLNLIRNASYVCTDSFHCSVFSILYKKEFFAFRRFSESSKQSTNSRLDTLFNIAGIDRQVMSGNEAVDQLITEKIDYDIVHKKIEEIRSQSKEYLNRAIMNIGNTDIQ